MFILDTKKEHIAVTEARKLGRADRRCGRHQLRPDLVDYAIPGNDDAIRAAGELMSRVISDAVLEGRFIRSKKAEACRIEAPPSATALEEAEIAEQQAKARAEAAAEAQPSARLASPPPPKPASEANAEW